MKKKILLSFLFQLAWLNVLPFSGRVITPYFEAIEYYDYVVKGKVISSKEINQYHIKVQALQIKVIDKMGQEIDDTVWVEPVIEEGAYPRFNYEGTSGLYYFAFKNNERGLFYDPSDPYFLLKINNDNVSASFTSSDIFFQRLLHLHRLREIRTDKFEKKLKRKLFK